MNGTIKFSENPWPQGHPLKDLYLGVLLHEPKGDLPAKATLDIRFRSENYYFPFSYEEMSEASKEQTSLTSNWEKIDTWLNYGSAYATSTASHDAMVLADGIDGFDIDCLDPSYALGTGTLVCGGLTSHQAIQIQRGLQGINIVGMDIVEVAPAYDVGEITALAASQLAKEMLYLNANRPV